MNLDANYINLLAHLRKSPRSLSDETIENSVAHYLSTLDSPTPLAATVLSSPSVSETLVLTCFRRSVHGKRVKIKESSGGIFSRPPSWVWKTWVEDILRGMQSIRPIYKLSGSAGLLLGLGDVARPECDSAKSPVEDEVLLSLAECMDVYASSHPWHSEFDAVKKQDSLKLSTIFAAQCLHLVPSQKLKALPLRRLKNQFMQTITSGFMHGTFLRPLRDSIKESNGVFSIPNESPFVKSISQVQSSGIMAYMSPLSRQTARILSVLLESDPFSVQSCMTTLQSIAMAIDDDWLKIMLMTIGGEERIAIDSQEIIRAMWTVLKTLLFSIIMLSTSALSTAVYIPPPHLHINLAKSVMITLFHLSFVISKFGGVTTTGSSGLPELKQAFYLALDIISIDRLQCESLIQQLGSGIDKSEQAKKAYALAATEQLIPVLSGSFIERAVLPLCMPHLSAPAYRETYESAHSVVLAIFGTRAQRGSKKGDFEDRIVPFYAHCLLENSNDDALSVEQLGLAFSSLVSGASTVVDGDDATEYTLAWYCVDALITHIANHPKDRHRLGLTLIACVPSLPLCLLPHMLEGVLHQIRDVSGEERQVLIQALFTVMTEKVGDREKEYTMKWWFENREELFGSELLPQERRSML